MSAISQPHLAAMLARHRELQATRRESLAASDCPNCPDVAASPSTRVVAGVSTSVVAGLPIEPQAEAATGLPTESPELAAERRYAELHRCRHRSIDSVRTEPCVCPSVTELPIHHCDLLDCDCADIRRPQSPAKFCGGCKSRQS